MSLDDYIHEQFCAFNEKHKTENKNKLFTKRVQGIRAELVNLLDEEQYNALRTYDDSLYFCSLAEREKFYHEGFMLGYQQEEKLTFKEDE